MDVCFPHRPLPAFEPDPQPHAPIYLPSQVPRAFDTQHSMATERANIRGQHSGHVNDHQMRSLLRSRL